MRPPGALRRMGGVGRYATLSLIAGQGVTNWSFRNGLPSWLPSN